jgi:hypothetical protein
LIDSEVAAPHAGKGGLHTSLDLAEPVTSALVEVEVAPDD